MKLLSTLALALVLSGASQLTCQAQLIINEVCYDPSNTNLDGDTNGDGVYDQTQDEFIEMVNIGTTPLDISKYQICDRVIAGNVRTVRHTIAPGTILAPGAAVVVFGGGTAVGNFGGATVFIDRGTAGLSMGNSGERVLVADSNGVTVDSLDTDALSDNPNESYTRSPDITGPYVQHAAARAGVLFSPGTLLTGSPFAGATSLAALKAQDFRLYPNPASDRLFVRTEGLLEPVVEVSDMAGRVLLSTKIVGNGLDISSLSSGLYNLRVTNATGNTLLRFHVNR